jgi:hypothetical protein
VERKYDTLKIEYHVSVEGESRDRYIVPSLWINSQRLGADVVVDLREVVATLRGPGEYFPLTCGCGEPGCAGIFQGIIVFHYWDTVRWLIPEPIIGLPEPDETEGDRVLRFMERYFQKADYRKAIVSGIEEGRKLVLQDAENAHIGPHGFSARDLLEMKIPPVQAG